MNENKFNGKGTLYDQYRPEYPAAFIDYLYHEAGFSRHCVIADIGSGTGIFTKQLLDHGNQVFAVEPNQDMRAVAEAKLKEYPQFVSVCGSAEQTSLAPNSIDYVTVAQAFHWFNVEKFKTECNRIIRPGGKTVLVWNNRDTTSDLIMENDRINRRFCKNYKGFSENNFDDRATDTFHAFFSEKYDIRWFQNDLWLNEESFIGRNLSSSYAPKPTDDTYYDYVCAISGLFLKYSSNNLLRFPTITQCYIGRT